MITEIKIQNLKKGQEFKRKPDAKKIWIRGDFNRFEKTYEAQNWDDISDFMHIKKDKIVFTGFEF